jgi:hypothetical protein
MRADKPQPPNLDLINRVQQARRLHDATAQPSQAAGVYWIEAPSLAADVPAPTARAGQWVIPTTANVVDTLWARIKTATEAGQLGFKAKVSTAAGPGQTSPDARLICVRTYDADDSADVERVYAGLRALGISGELRYERDQA